MGTGSWRACRKMLVKGDILEKTISGGNLGGWCGGGKGGRDKIHFPGTCLLLSGVRNGLGDRNDSCMNASGLVCDVSMR